MPPTFDLTGIWSSSDGTIQLYQSASDVTGVMVNKHFAHLLRGKFEDSETEVALYTDRRNRSNGCTTAMKITIKITAKDRFQLRWLALDSKCDLKEGQTGAAKEYKRQL